ncbi:hypothetical protein BKI52_31430 [marine bacterium AO1-C]|nr:hypothetical protein BKI52_31430 [marine bacterium AO1-C]
MMRLIIGLLLVISPRIILGQLHQVSVSFTKDSKTIELQDDFQIYIVFKDSISTTVIKPVIKSNAFLMPIFKKGTIGIIVFRYKKYLIALKRGVYLDQSVEFNFGIDYKPFDSELTNGRKLEKVKLIDYLKVYPKKTGDGVISTGYIQDVKLYKISILKLINPKGRLKNLKS